MPNVACFADNGPDLDAFSFSTVSSICQPPLRSTPLGVGRDDVIGLDDMDWYVLSSRQSWWYQENHDDGAPCDGLNAVQC